MSEADTRTLTLVAEDKRRLMPWKFELRNYTTGNYRVFSFWTEEEAKSARADLMQTLDVLNIEIVR